MNIILETKRLLLREIDFTDIHDLFEMDSDPAVHLYIDNKPVQSLQEVKDVVELLQYQYKQYGIARWAVVEKLTNECVGWSGLKYFTKVLNNHINFYELGYRFKQKHWGKGFATESSKAILNYGFVRLKIDKIYAITDAKNEKSKNVLHKLGFECKDFFDDEGTFTAWYELEKFKWREYIELGRI